MFRNCIKFTSYVKEGKQQRGMFKEKYRDAYNELEIRMDQSLALDLDESSKCPIPKGKSSTPKIASSFTICNDAFESEISKRISWRSTKKEKQQQCPAQIDTLSECGDVSRPPSKNQNHDRRLSKRISALSTLKEKSEKDQQIQSPSNCNTNSDPDSIRQYSGAEKPATVATRNSAKESCHLEEDFWEIDKILKVRFLNGKMKWCLVRWKGFTSDDDSWEPANGLCDTACKSLFM